jgi:hypothetical protein
MILCLINIRLQFHAVIELVETTAAVDLVFAN